MSFDPLDVFGGAVGSIFKRLLYFASAIWLGCATAVVALIVSFLVAGGTLDFGFVWSFLLAPLGLINGWIAVNFLTVAIGLAYSVKAADPGYKGWMILAGAASLGVMLGRGFSEKWLSLAAGWIAWLALIAMLGTGVWLLCQYFAARWAHHLMHVQAETTVRGIEREEIVRERLEASRPPDAPPGVVVDLKH
jgi:ABC-type multidrug transport system fused ATPase/permease subunit